MHVFVLQQCAAGAGHTRINSNMQFKYTNVCGRRQLHVNSFFFLFLLVSSILVDSIHSIGTEGVFAKFKNKMPIMHIDGSRERKRQIKRFLCANNYWGQIQFSISYQTNEISTQSQTNWSHNEKWHVSICLILYL